MFAIVEARGDENLLEILEKEKVTAAQKHLNMKIIHVETKDFGVKHYKCILEFNRMVTTGLPEDTKIET